MRNISRSMSDIYIVEFRFRTAITRIFITDNIYWL